MTVNISPRQRALLRIWSSERADDLVVILADEAAAREDDLARELRHQAESANPTVSRRLRLMATAIDEIHTIVERFASLQDMAGLLAC